MKIMNVEIKFEGWISLLFSVIVGVGLWMLFSELTPLRINNSEDQTVRLAGILSATVANAWGVNVLKGAKHVFLILMGSIVAMVVAKMVLSLFN